VDEDFEPSTGGDSGLDEEEIPSHAKVADVDKLEDAELLLSPTQAYNVIVLHCQKQVNKVQILKRLDYFSNGKAQMDIPLC
jgi:hypothetical protein